MSTFDFNKELVVHSSTFRSITNVKFICDTMLGGLSRALRKVGIDAISLTSNDNVDHYIQVAQRENRYFLTRGSSYVRVMELNCTHFTIPPGI